MKKSCPYCGRLHDVKDTCPRKPKPVYNNKHTGRAGELRNMNIWKTKRAVIKERDKHLCRACLAQGKLNTKNLSVHHIIPINEDERHWLDDDNLITLCSLCHEQAESGEISREYLRDLAATAPKLTPLTQRGRK